MGYINLIKEKVDLVSLVSEYTELKENGNNYIGLCPLHEEDTPSFFIDRGKQLFYCFGCGKGGDAISFIMEAENLSFKEAVNYLIRKYRIRLFNKKQFKPSIKSYLFKLNKELSCLFYDNLFSFYSGVVYDEFKFSYDTIKLFKIGYVSNNLDDIIKRYSKDTLIKSGLFSWRNNKPHFKLNNGVVFPIFSSIGDILSFVVIHRQGNKLKQQYLSDTPIFKKREAVFGINVTKQNIKKEGYVIIVNNLTNAIHLHQSGIKNVVSKISGNLTREQALNIKKYTTEVILAYDLDNKSLDSIKKDKSTLSDVGVFVRIWNNKNSLVDLTKKVNINYVKDILNELISKEVKRNIIKAIGVV